MPLAEVYLVNIVPRKRTTCPALTPARLMSATIPS